MARIRSIKPEFAQSESMGRVSREARLCFVLLWTIADDFGRARGNSRMLASLLFPYDDDAKKHIDGWLTELSSEGCIASYEVSGASYIQVCNWSLHQKIDKPSQSRFPGPDEASRTFANVLESFPRKGKEGKGEEGKGSGEEGSAEPQSASTPPDVDPPVEVLASLPLADGTDYAVTEVMLADWQSAYPAVDVAQQLREMRAWCNANPQNRKTPRGVASFVVRWLAKEQDRAPTVRRLTASVPTESRPAWAIAAGFANRFEAENAGCNVKTAALFRDGKRLEVAA